MPDYFEPKKSWLSAVRVGLIEYLQSATEGMDWLYFDSIIVPDYGAKGGIKLFKKTELDNTDLNVDNNLARIATLQIRVLLADSNPLECEYRLCDWDEWLAEVIHELSLKGINGNWRGVNVRNGLMGLRQTVRGSVFIAEEVPGIQIQEDMCPGLLIAEYDYKYEIDTVINF